MKKPKITKVTFVGSHPLAPAGARRRRVKPVYFLSTIGFLSDEEQARNPHVGAYRCRSVGWFPTIEDAVEVIEGNYGDIEEQGYYQVAVIERMEWGLYPHMYCDESIWYEFVTEGTGCERKVTAKKIDKPELLKCVIGFGIG